MVGFMILTALTLFMLSSGPDIEAKNKAFVQLHIAQCAQVQALATMSRKPCECGKFFYFSENEVSYRKSFCEEEFLRIIEDQEIKEKYTK